LAAPFAHSSQSRSHAEGESIDVFSAAGLKQPDISIEIRSLPTLAHCFPRSFTFYVAHPARSILSDQFLAEVRGPQERQKFECRRKKLLHFLIHHSYF